jgi:YggT family protein
MPVSVKVAVDAALNFYSLLIIVYVLMSWFPVSGVLQDAYRVLASVVDPYLRLFRRIVPVMGALDFSPFVAILVLWAVRMFVVPYIPF